MGVPNRIILFYSIHPWVTHDIRDYLYIRGFGIRGYNLYGWHEYRILRLRLVPATTKNVLHEGHQKDIIEFIHEGAILVHISDNVVVNERVAEVSKVFTTFKDLVLYKAGVIRMVTVLTTVQRKGSRPLTGTPQEATRTARQSARGRPTPLAGSGSCCGCRCGPGAASEAWLRKWRSMLTLNARAHRLRAAERWRRVSTAGEKGGSGIGTYASHRGASSRPRPRQSPMRDRHAAASWGNGVGWSSCACGGRGARVLLDVERAAEAEVGLRERCGQRCGEEVAARQDAHVRARGGRGGGGAREVLGEHLVDAGENDEESCTSLVELHYLIKRPSARRDKMIERGDARCGCAPLHNQIDITGHFATYVWIETSNANFCKYLLLTSMGGTVYVLGPGQTHKDIRDPDLNVWVSWLSFLEFRAIVLRATIAFLEAVSAKQISKAMLVEEGLAAPEDVEGVDEALIVVNYRARIDAAISLLKTWVHTRQTPIPQGGNWILNYECPIDLDKVNPTHVAAEKAIPAHTLRELRLAGIHALIMLADRDGKMPHAQAKEVERVLLLVRPYCEWPEDWDPPPPASYQPPPPPPPTRAGNSAENNDNADGGDKDEDANGGDEDEDSDDYTGLDERHIIDKFIYLFGAVPLGGTVHTS
ncbi:hypothetical protein GGX14DRAFT_659720 [Mycena pura]|uniref:Uncharacterized protein n=1 Tax=Mycena pura TaxID=153505 RepID=A0AAD6V4C3_9AGAR|nr:hypothetical protein GGX14DRAFT_659720 [Mycena pura]